MKKEITGESKVYSEFFTNLAVAWFTGGIITPLLIKPKGFSETMISFLGIISAFSCLKLATFFAMEEK